MKLIFLDIDGVLVTRRPGVMEDRLLANLKRVVDSTGSTIVLSSDWRRHPLARAEAQRVLGTHGLSFIASTPCLSVYMAQRPTEIMQWRREFLRTTGREEVTHWVAIDDRQLLEEKHGRYLRGHFVQTSLMHGLTEAAAEECIRILNAEVGARPQDAADESLGREGLFEGFGRGNNLAGGGSARGQSAGPAMVTGRSRATSLLGDRTCPPPPPSLGDVNGGPLALNTLGSSTTGRTRGRSHPPSYGQRRAGR